MHDRYYILSDRVPIAVDHMTWARWMEASDVHGVRRVKSDEINDRSIVTTLFLGVDHNLGEGKPLIFETLVLGGPLHGKIDRYSTWEEAERGHADMVTKARLADRHE